MPYLRPRVLNKGQPEPGKCRFVPTIADGPEHLFAKDKKGVLPKNTSYGKDAKTPPVSYLPLHQWAKKQDRKLAPNPEKTAKTERGSFIDRIYFDSKKYNSPGPGKYFQPVKKEDIGTVKKDKKEIERPNFLYDYEYLGLNNPGPGTYHFKDTWAEAGKKRVSTADKKPGYVPQGWKIKNNKNCGPGQYEINRLLSVAEDKSKGKKTLVNIPIYERTATLGVINKVGLIL